MSGDEDLGTAAGQRALLFSRPARGLGKRGLPDGQGTRSLHQLVLLDGADVSAHPGPHRHDLHTSYMCSSSHTQTPQPRDTHGPRAGHIDTRSLIHALMDTPHRPVDTGLQRRWAPRSRDTHTHSQVLTQHTQTPGTHTHAPQTHPDVLRSRHTCAHGRIHTLKQT